MNDTQPNFVQFARVPISGGALSSPYQLDSDPNARIKAAEDFTISINTISRQLYEKYTDFYKAGKHDNDYFAVFSSIGLGNQNQPTLKIHFLKHIKNMTQDYTTIWAENIETIEDYRDDGESERSRRLYLSFHCFCQNIGSEDTFRNIVNAGKKILDIAGAIFPALFPYTAVGKAAIKGVNNLLKKIDKIQQECKQVEFAWYPVSEVHSVEVIGEAPLQTGAYIFFFEETNISNLELRKNGIVRSLLGEEVNPYIVVNIKKGITLAPGQLNTKMAAEIMSQFQDNFGELSAETSKDLSSLSRDFEDVASSVKFARQFERYYQLKRKSDRLPEEEARLNKLQAVLRDRLPSWDG